MKPELVLEIMRCTNAVHVGSLTQKVQRPFPGRPGHHYTDTRKLAPHPRP